MNLPFIRYNNLGGTFVRFVTIHACDGQTDRQTDGRIDRQTDRLLCRKTACILQRGKNVAIANAWQLEAARYRSVPLRFNFVARAKFEVAHPIR